MRLRLHILDHELRSNCGLKNCSVVFVVVVVAFVVIVVVVVQCLLK